MKVVLLDDPLAACDPTVAQRLMQRVIGPRGLLKDKLRVFVSSSLEPLAEADAIHVLAAGGVAESGDRCSARGRARGVIVLLIDLLIIRQLCGAGGRGWGIIITQLITMN